MRILIADDDRTSRTIVSLVLAKRGHEVVATNDGAEAWEALQKPDAPRLAILDWMMPGFEGPEVCRRVRAHPGSRRPYLILLTSRGAPNDIGAGLDSGADDYLEKPLRPAELGARVEVGRRMITLQDSCEQKTGELQASLAELNTLRGIVPLCARCRHRRDDASFMARVEAYLAARSGAVFATELCPDCSAGHSPGEQRLELRR